MKTLITITLLTFTLLAQERVLLRIGANGQQEAIPLKKGEHAKDVIERLENQRTSMVSTDNTAGLVDTLKYFTTESELTTNFGWTHQDVALQWYMTNCDGLVKEFWWRNYEKGGNVRKASIRAWNVDQRISSLPLKVTSPYFGFYSDPNDSDQQITPFKPEAGNQWFYKKGINQYTDSTIYGFDPLGSESRWKKGGVQVTLDSLQWQKVSLLEIGETLYVKSGIPFGFTLQNDTKKTDIKNGMIDERMEILSWNTYMTNHSLKFYETSRDGAGGWVLRSDYGWGMFVVLEYTDDRPPRITTAYATTTVFTPINKFLFSITDDNPIGGPAGVQSAYFHSKKGAATVLYDSIPLTKESAYYSVQHPSIGLLDTIYWYVTAADVNGNRASTTVRKISRYGPKKSTLYVNNQQYEYPPAIILPQPQLPYDVWSTKNDGTGELSALFSLYRNIMVIDGVQPARNVYPALSQWLANGTAADKRNLFFTSQNFGCFITPNCSDTAFSSNAWEYQYLGLEKLGPQDLPPTNRPMRIIVQSDTITRHLLKYEQDSAVTLWLNPLFELGFNGYPDAMTPRAGASVLFKDGAGLKTLGVIHRGATFNSLFLAFDDRALQFRSDTSLSSSADPKYHWIGELKMIPAAFFESVTTNAGEQNNQLPNSYYLGQNYPNPFNPSTTIEYSVASKSNVTISIYNTLGQKVATIVNETKDPGTYHAEWNATHMASGLYFYAMRAGNYTSVKKMLLLK